MTLVLHVVSHQPSMGRESALPIVDHGVRRVKDVPRETLKIASRAASCDVPRGTFTTAVAWRGLRRVAARDPPRARLEGRWLRRHRLAARAPRRRSPATPDHL